MDQNDQRTFGYVYTTNDSRRQFWAIKTERMALFTILALKKQIEKALEPSSISEIVIQVY